ncbi:hypothetical protein C8R43DRAFT_1233098 [Mycena crocata]|nr:hypothetical protein C8R43DRAFT_1233098 [Mycena crocata]
MLPASSTTSLVAGGGDDLNDVVRIHPAQAGGLWTRTSYLPSPAAPTGLGALSAQSAHLSKMGRASAHHNASAMRTPTATVHIGSDGARAFMGSFSTPRPPFPTVELARRGSHAQICTYAPCQHCQPAPAAPDDALRIKPRVGIFQIGRNFHTPYSNLVLDFSLKIRGFGSTSTSKPQIFSLFGSLTETIFDSCCISVRSGFSCLRRQGLWSDYLDCSDSISFKKLELKTQTVFVFFQFRSHPTAIRLTTGIIEGRDYLQNVNGPPLSNAGATLQLDKGFLTVRLVASKTATIFDYMQDTWTRRLEGRNHLLFFARNIRFDLHFGPQNHRYSKLDTSSTANESFNIVHAETLHGWLYNKRPSGSIRSLNHRDKTLCQRGHSRLDVYEYIFAVIHMLYHLSNQAKFQNFEVILHHEMGNHVMLLYPSIHPKCRLDTPRDLSEPFNEPQRSVSSFGRSQGIGAAKFSCVAANEDSQSKLLTSTYLAEFRPDRFRVGPRFVDALNAPSPRRVRDSEASPFLESSKPRFDHLQLSTPTTAPALPRCAEASFRMHKNMLVHILNTSPDKFDLPADLLCRSLQGRDPWHRTDSPHRPRFDSGFLRQVLCCLFGNSALTNPPGEHIGAFVISTYLHGVCANSSETTLRTVVRSTFIVRASNPRPQARRFKDQPPAWDSRRRRFATMRACDSPCSNGDLTCLAKLCTDSVGPTLRIVVWTRATRALEVCRLRGQDPEGPSRSPTNIAVCSHSPLRARLVH